MLLLQPSDFVTVHIGDVFIKVNILRQMGGVENVSRTIDWLKQEVVHAYVSRNPSGTTNALYLFHNDCSEIVFYVRLKKLSCMKN